MKYFVYLRVDGTRHLEPYSATAYEQADSDEEVIEYLVIPFDAESRGKAEEIAHADIDQYLSALKFIIEEWGEIDRLFTTLHFLTDA